MFPCQDRLLKGLLLAALTILFVGCASTSSVVKKSAAADFQCQKGEIQVKGSQDGIHWLAEGCGQKAEYKCGGCAFGPMKCRQTAK